MALVEVDHDPFAEEPQAKQAKAPRMVEVNHDPFAPPARAADPLPGVGDYEMPVPADPPPTQPPPQPRDRAVRMADAYDMGVAPVPGGRRERIDRSPTVGAYEATTTRGERILNPLEAGARQGLSALRANEAQSRLDWDQALAEAGALYDAGDRRGAMRVYQDRMRSSGIPWPAVVDPAARAEWAGAMSQRTGRAFAGAADQQRRAAEIPQHPAAQRMMQAKTWGEAGAAFWEDPIGAVQSIGLQSLPQTVPALAAGAVGGPVAGAAVMGGTSMAQEYASTVMESLQEAGIDTADPAALQRAFSDPAVIDSIRRKASLKGTIVGAGDALTMGLAGRVLAPAMRSRLAREAVNVPVQIAAQGAAGGGFEAASQLATEGRIDKPGAVLGELVGETFSAPGDVAALAAHRRPSAEAVQPATPPERIEPTMPLPAAIQQPPAAPQLAPAQAPAPPNPPAPAAPEAAPGDLSTRAADFARIIEDGRPLAEQRAEQAERVKQEEIAAATVAVGQVPAGSPVVLPDGTQGQLVGYESVPLDDGSGEVPLAIVETAAGRELVLPQELQVPPPPAAPPQVPTAPVEPESAYLSAVSQRLPQGFKIERTQEGYALRDPGGAVLAQNKTMTAARAEQWMREAEAAQALVERGTVKPPQAEPAAQPAPAQMGQQPVAPFAPSAAAPAVAPVQQDIKPPAAPRPAEPPAAQQGPSLTADVDGVPVSFPDRYHAALFGIAQRIASGERGQSVRRDAAELFQSFRTFVENDPGGEAPFSNPSHTIKLARDYAEDILAEARAARGAGRPVSAPSVIDPDERYRWDERRILEASGAPASIMALDPDTISVDAKRFQFKAGGDAAGVTEQLKGVTRWDDTLSGLALVYEDRSGRRWIVDGHQRLGLARRLKAGGQSGVRINARVIREADGKTPQEAMVTAAIKNIAEGTGSAVDAAKVLRLIERDPTLAAKVSALPPLPPQSALVRDARALANLGDDAFGMVVNDVVESSHAAHVGRLISDHAQQSAALGVLAKAEPRTANEARILVEQIREAGFTAGTQEDMFGALQTADSLFVERARVLDMAMKSLLRDRNVYKTLVNEEGRIAEAGNKLSRKANEERLTDDERTYLALERLGARKGPVGDAVGRAAQQLKGGATLRSASAGLVRDVGGLVRGGLERGAEAGGPGQANEVAPAPVEPTERRPAAAATPPKAATAPRDAGNVTLDGRALAMGRVMRGLDSADDHRALSASGVSGGISRNGADALLRQMGVKGAAVRRILAGAEVRDKTKNSQHAYWIAEIVADGQKHLGIARQESAEQPTSQDGPGLFEPAPSQAKFSARPRATEQTDQGEQVLIPGVKPVTDKDRAEAKGRKPAKGGNAPLDFGLFDTGARKQGSLFSARQRENVAAGKGGDTASAAFKRWFEGSVFRRKDGTPIALWLRDDDEIGVRTAYPTLPAHWAKDKDRIVEVYVSARKPLNLTTAGRDDLLDVLNKWRVATKRLPHPVNAKPSADKVRAEFRQAIGVPAFVKWLAKATPYDVLIGRKEGQTVDRVIPLSPGAMKAIDNRGAWDKNASDLWDRGDNAQGREARGVRAGDRPVDGAGAVRPGGLRPSGPGRASVAGRAASREGAGFAPGAALALQVKQSGQKDLPSFLDLIRRLSKTVNPDATIRFAPTLTGSGEGLKAHGIADDTAEIGGYFTEEDGKAVIALSLADKFDPLWTSRHELMHSVWKLLKPEERSALKDHFGGRTEAEFEEKASDGFADFMQGKPLDLPGPVARIFRKLANFLRRIATALRGKGYAKVNDLFDAVARGEVAGRGDAAGAGGAPKFHPAWHGGPHDFDQFSTDKIGTGEGAQAYGWGLYFAGKKEVAEYYRDAIGGSSTEYLVDGKTAFSGKKPGSLWFGDDSPEQIAIGMVANNYGSIERASSVVDGLLDNGFGKERGEALKAAIRALDGKKVERVETPKGRLYQVDLAPKEDEYLDWDKPFSAQSPAVREALRKSGVYQGYRENLSDYSSPQGTRGSVPRGAYIYGFLEHKLGSQEAASKALKAAGIPGIRYLDAGSRDKGKGSHNYVIFDAKDVKIEAKFSLLGRDPLAVTEIPDGKSTTVALPSPRGPKDFELARNPSPSTAKRLARESQFGQLRALLYEGSGDMLLWNGEKAMHADVDLGVTRPTRGDTPLRMQIVVKDGKPTADSSLGSSEQIKRFAEHPRVAPILADQGPWAIGRARKGLEPEERYSARTRQGNLMHVGSVWDTTTATEGVVETLSDANRTLMERLRSATSMGAIQSTVDRTRTLLQDRFLPLRRAQEAVAKMRGTAKVLDSENAYRAEELYSGRAGEKLLQIERTHKKPILEAIHALNPQDGAAALDQVEAYLYARHAKERNAQIARINPKFAPGEGSGMTDAEADAILAKSRADGSIDRLEPIAKMVDAMLAQSIRERVESGLMSEKEAATWRRTYKAYVPLRGTAEADGSLSGPKIGKGYDVKGKESRRAFGRETKATDILANAFAISEEAVIRGEKNRVVKALANLVQNAPDKAYWEVDKVEKRPVINKDTGMVEYRSMVPMGEEQKTVHFKLDGDVHRIVLHDPRLAESVKTLHADQVGGLTRLLGTVNRYLSLVNTGLNPEFLITNALRDSQAALVNIQQFDETGIAKKMLRYWGPAFKAGFTGGLEGKADTVWQQRFREFAGAGGKVSFWKPDDVEGMRTQLTAELKRMERGKGDPREMGRKALAWIEKTNQAVDNAIRLAAFQAFREAGMSAEDAASIAKNLTVNFNRRGAWGPQLNALYLFYNASVQGTAVLMHAMRNKRVRRILYGAVALGVAVELLNAFLLSGMDDDDEKRWDKVSDFEKSRSLILMNPWGGKPDFIKIPMPYGYNTFVDLGRNMAATLRGAQTPAKALGNVFTTAAKSFNPFGDLLGAPTIAVTPLQIALNKNFTGKPIKPEQQWDKNLPESEKAWENTTKLSKEAARFLNWATGGSQFKEGAISVSPAVIDHAGQQIVGAAGAFAGRTVDFVWKAATGDKIEAGDVPMLRTLARNVTPGAEKARVYDRMKEVDQLADRLKDMRKAKADVTDLMRESGPLIALARDADRTRKVLKAIRTQRAGVKGDESLSMQGKRDQLREMEQRELVAVQTFNRSYMRAKRQVGSAPD